MKENWLKKFIRQVNNVTFSLARFQIDFHISRKFLNLKKYKETKKKFFLEFLIRFISVTTARITIYKWNNRFRYFHNFNQGWSLIYIISREYYVSLFASTLKTQSVVKRNWRWLALINYL